MILLPHMPGVSLSLSAGDVAGNALPPQLSTPSENATINLIRLLVERGVLAPEDSVDLIRQAEREAQIARNQTTAIQTAAAEIRAATEEEAKFSDEDIRVTYVPEYVRQEIAADVRHELSQRYSRFDDRERPESPEWIHRFRPYGDFRLRAEYINFPEGNDSTGAFTDFNAINTGAPFDLAGSVFPPVLNADQDRDRTRLRVRFGFETDIEEDLTFRLRLATGNGISPVSTNQTLGSPGNFGKYQIWLDRAFLHYKMSPSADLTLDLLAGRFENPFFSTSLIWDGDIGFDGIALRGRYEINSDWSTFFTLGAFPVFNTALNFPSNRGDKFSSDDRWLYGAQFGFDHTVNKNINLRASLALYEFSEVEGKLSTPFTPLSAADAGDTDGRRPTFAQKGNTYMPLRQIAPAPENNFGNSNQFQYFGLATPFRVAAASFRADFNHYEPVQVSVFGELIQNLAADDGDIEALAVNNRGPEPAPGALGRYEGGDLGWIAGVSVGDPLMNARGHWRVGLDYRYLESDATVDAFTDSTWGLGGTNMKGVSLTGHYMITPSMTLGARWLSASEIAGPRFRSDIINIDLSTEF
ncbi:MAG: putative porin [Opitutales bacterium]